MKTPLLQLAAPEKLEELTTYLISELTELQEIAQNFRLTQDDPVQILRPIEISSAPTMPLRILMFQILHTGARML